MDHLYVLLSKKNLDVDDLIRNEVCTLSLKIDGNAFQIGSDGDVVKYYKRSGSPGKLSPSKEITVYDCCFNEFYGDAVKYFRNKEDILKEYDIVNCEIMDKQHIIRYDNEADPKIYLLSAVKNGEFISKEESEELAEDLGISRCPVIYSDDVLPDDIADVILEHKNKAKRFSGSVRQLSNNDLYEAVTDLLPDDINWEEQEGLVFSWNYEGENISAKLNNPYFIDKWFDMKESDESTMETGYNKFARIFVDKCEDHIKGFASWRSVNEYKTELDYLKDEEYVENILNLFNMFTSSDIKDLYDSYDVEPNVDPANSKFILEICPELDKKLGYEAYRSVLNVIFVLMYKKKKNKSNLMSWSTQLKINDLIDYLH